MGGRAGIWKKEPDYLMNQRNEFFPTEDNQESFFPHDSSWRQNWLTSPGRGPREVNKIRFPSLPVDHGRAWTNDRQSLSSFFQGAWD